MFPMWMYHPTKGGVKFETPEQFAKAGSGWEDSPEKVGLVPEVPTLPGEMLHFPVPEQPVDPFEDASVATDEEKAASAARAAKNARRASIPTTPVTRRAAVKRR